MPSKRLTITLQGDLADALEKLTSALNEGRQEPVPMAQIFRVALRRLLDDNKKNPVEVSNQFELPFK